MRGDAKLRSEAPVKIHGTAETRMIGDQVVRKHGIQEQSTRFVEPQGPEHLFRWCISRLLEIPPQLALGDIHLHGHFLEGTGLTIGVQPWTPTGKSPLPETELKGFGVAGADRKWVWAKATIAGDSVIVSSDEVKEPVAVRYGWANTPPCNLYNKEGLPASPFRTDDWN